MSLMTTKQLCICEDPKGRGICAECETKIELAAKLNMPYVGRDAEGKPEFIGTNEQWTDFDKMLNTEPCEHCLHDSPCRMHYNEQLKANIGEVEYNKPTKGNF